MAPMYYRHAKIAVVVFDITKAPPTVENLENWRRMVVSYASQNVVIAVAGGKSDLDHHEELDLDALRAACTSVGLQFFKVGAYRSMHIVHVQCLASCFPNELLTVCPTDPLTWPDERRYGRGRGRFIHLGDPSGDEREEGKKFQRRRRRGCDFGGGLGGAWQCGKRQLDRGVGRQNRTARGQTRRRRQEQEHKGGGIYLLLTQLLISGMTGRRRSRKV